MPTFTFDHAELTTEHTRTPIHDVRLEVAIPALPPTDAAPAPDLLRGSIQVTGEFTFRGVPSGNPFRPGQLLTLKLTTADGRASKPPVLLTQLKEIRPVSAKERDYCWEFLIPARPSQDPGGLFRREGEGPPRPEEQPRQVTAGVWNRPVLPLAPIEQLDPNAKEMNVEGLLAYLGTLGNVMDTPAVKFTLEGGFTRG